MRNHKHHHSVSHNELDLRIAALAEGDMSAMEALYEATNAAVYAFALSILKNSHDAEDVLHDCYIHIYMAAGSYETSDKPMAWILTIARNLCLKRLRANSRTTPLDAEDFREHPALSEEMTVEDKLLLEQCMQMLTDEERQILVLHAVAGFKHREIAELLDLALPTVLSKYHRAIKKLRAHL